MIILCVDIKYLMLFAFSTAERQRPYLMTRVQGTNDYINAAFLDVSVCILTSTLSQKKQKILRL